MSDQPIGPTLHGLGVDPLARHRNEGDEFMSNYDCEVCGKTPEQAAIHRTSPKGGAFRGRCAGCLGQSRPSSTNEERILDALAPINTPFAERAGCAAHDGMHLVGDCALTAPTPPTPALDAPPVPEATPEPTEAAEGALRQSVAAILDRVTASLAWTKDRAVMEEIRDDLATALGLVDDGQPRTWCLPDEPPTEVMAIDCACHGRWQRIYASPGGRWQLTRPADPRLGPYLVDWQALYGEHIVLGQTLTDATSEVS